MGGVLIVADFTRREGDAVASEVEEHSTVATVRAFPSARHCKMIETIADRMVGCVSIEAADEELVEHLEIQWAFLEQAGVAADEVEADCRHFARAAWLRYERLQHDAGAA